MQFAAADALMIPLLASQSYVDVLVVCLCKPRGKLGGSEGVRQDEFRTATELINKSYDK